MNSFEQICEILNLKHDSTGAPVVKRTSGPLTLFQPGGQIMPNILSSELGARQAQREVVKIFFLIFPTGLEVHLEDMF